MEDYFVSVIRIGVAVGMVSYPRYWKKGLKKKGDWRYQFVVQLRGCVLNCPYCYVTQDGVWGSV